MAETKIFRFVPLLKQTLWGGDRIIPFKKLNSSLDSVGESWEVSCVAGHETVVSVGEYAGMSLGELVASLKDKLVGRACYEAFGNEFPLLIKFIDARSQLSIQVHPDDDTARRRGFSRGKTEMWYVMHSEPGAMLYSGLKQPITPEDYERMVDDGTITDVLDRYDVRQGDVFYLPAGRIHSIGAGVFLAEIQETSDVTYRIYDFKRKDKDGHYRQLHTAEARDCIDYNVAGDHRTHYTPRKNEKVELVSCRWFTTSLYDIGETKAIDYSSLDSFVVLIGIAGSGTISVDGSAPEAFHAGDTLLLPAVAGSVSVSGSLKFLETHI